MAEITSILGTDSLSSSRIVINDNFEALNDELTGLSNILDPIGGTLNLTGNLTAATLTVTGKFVIGDDTITASKPMTVTQLNLTGGLKHSAPSAAITATSLTAYDYSTYPIGITGSFDPGSATNGTQITLVSTAGTVTVTATLVAGATSISMPINSTLTLRWWDGAWYIISQYGVTIS